MSLPACSRRRRTEGMALAWREAAGRSQGKEGYQFGDVTRSVARSLSSRYAAIVPGFSRRAAAPEPDDFEPIDALGQPCQGADFSGSRASALERKCSLLFRFLPEAALLGEGQYGRVWRARRRGTCDLFAVKDVRVSQRDALLAKRELEIAEIIRAQPHPCVVEIFQIWSKDCEETGQLYWLVMELCPGGDLLARIAAARASARTDVRAYAPPAAAGRWLAQIFLGLEHVHLILGLLFRDLKPGNVVLDAAGRAKLTDFGQGREGLRSEGCWSFGFPAGSLGFIAPEVLEGEEYDESADLYSLGVLAWVLLTGGVADCEEPAPPCNGIDEEWELLARCLADPAGNRALCLHETALDLVTALTRRQPEQRPRHEGVRAHSYFAGTLRLPEGGVGGRETLCAWLAAMSC